MTGELLAPVVKTLVILYLKIFDNYTLSNKKTYWQPQKYKLGEIVRHKAFQ